MSDTGAPPPKPKPGSLRDRIAAFEKKPETTSGSAPVPRPKPGNISWKPKAPSPPDSPSGSDIPKANTGGMSASDAKESISKAGSLKERMAALQGKGAFGAPPPPVAPKPVVERPKWKPPPAVSSEEGKESEESPKAEESINDEDTPTPAPEEPQEPDPEEEERQRRAAITARMARLGGARVGMGPPVFGSKPAVKKPEPEAEASEPTEEAKTDESNSAPSAKPKTTVMPLPAAPRRAGPPRKKSAASTKSTPTPDSEQQPPVPPLNPDAGEPQVAARETLAAMGPEGDESVDITFQVQAGDAQAAAEEDEEERKKRVAEKMAQMGAVNPLAAPVEEPVRERDSLSSQRRSSSDSVVADSVPLPPPRRSSSSSVRSQIRKDSSELEDEPSTMLQTGVTSISEEPETEVELYPTTEQSEEIVVLEEVDEPAAENVQQTEEEPQEEISTRPPPPLRRNTRPPSVSLPHLQPEPVDVPVEVGIDEPEIEIREEPSSPPPPPPPRSTRPTSLSQPLMSPPPTRTPPEFKEDGGDVVPAVSAIRRALPPPPMRIVDDEDEEQDIPEHDDPGAPMLRVIPATPAVIPPTPAPSKAPAADARRKGAGSPEPRFKLPSIPNSDREVEDDDVEDDEEIAEAKRVSPQKPRRESLSIPNVAAENVNDNVHALPPYSSSERPSRAVPGLPSDEEEDKMLFIPPRTGQEDNEALIIPPRPADASNTDSPPALSVSDHDEREILDEDEGDPIDPAFHTPSRRSSTVNLKEAAAQQDATAASPTEEAVVPEEDEEQARRRTIAERMAKLGGIKFGAPVPVPAARPSRQEMEESTESSEPAGELDEEEEERARKERIAKKLANMGGMRFGMMPMMGMPGSVPPKPVREPSDDTAAPPSSPPNRAVPPPRTAPPPPAPETDSEYETHSAHTSDDGVKVEAEESELEEIHHEEVEAEEETDAPPPPVPSREGRRSSVQAQPVRKDTQSPPPVPLARPPVPTSLPTRKPSSSSQTTTTRKSSADSTTSPTSSTIRKTSAPYKPQSDYVMVEEPLEYEPPVPSPPIPPKSNWPGAPPRAVPPAPASPPPTQMSDSVSSQWELPAIPKASLELGAATDLSNSWSDELISSITSPPATGDKQQLPPKQSGPDYESVTLSSDELTAIWGRVGVHICEIATALFEKSKKALIGDGTYHGFVQAVLAEVPMAGPVTPSSYGYPIYVQNGGSVQKRASEIMPGDVVTLHDAKLKGHKGLQTYSQSVGTGEPAVGIIGEFEAKKFKLRVFQANQHVGQQTVESVSYRLEDLKSGIVKVYRVMDA